MIAPAIHLVELRLEFPRAERDLRWRRCDWRSCTDPPQSAVKASSCQSKRRRGCRAETARPARSEKLLPRCLWPGSVGSDMRDFEYRAAWFSPYAVGVLR